MQQTIKIIKIKDINAAKNGMHILSVLYKIDKQKMINQLSDNVAFFLPTRKDSIHWDIEDIYNIKTYLSDGVELEFNDVQEAA